MKILLTGSSGQLGSLLATQLHAHADVIAPSRADMDLARPEQIRACIRQHQPQLIINTAAYTAVDQAETDPALAMHINAEAPAIMAAEAQRLGAGLLHYSTDYVFDGRQSTPYAENAAPHPVNVYGHSKWLGEQQIATGCEAHWIVRCSWIYSVSGKNFLRTIWRLAQERQQLQVVDDQIGAPTWAHSIAAISIQMLIQAQQSPAGIQAYLRSTAGIYHLAARGHTSWHGMALHILQRMEQAGIALQLTPQYLHAIASAVYAAPAQRPHNSKLQTDKLERLFHLVLPDWRDDLDACISELVHATNSKAQPSSSNTE